MPSNSPETRPATHASADDHACDLAACRQMLRVGSKSFFAASLLLPKRVRDPASALYAFCRLADDAVDLADDPAEGLADIRFRLDRAYAGDPLPLSVDRAFAEVVARFQIPRAVPDALFEGFEWDATGRRYETLAEVEAYAVRVAGTVGVMMTLLMGVRDADVLARACDLGVAMQLTNIARDVGEDARAGRLYLPRAWLAEAGISADAFLASPHFSPALGSVIGRLLGVARGYYLRANAGIAQLPADCRPAIRAASLIYARIGRGIAMRGHDSVNARAVIGKAMKLALIARALKSQPGAINDLVAEPVLSARSLIEASAGPRLVDARRQLHQPRLVDRYIRVVDLFEQLERRSLARRGQLVR
jgi:phytoene synthase